MSRRSNFKSTKKDIQLSFKKAGILDIPMIFNLLQEGSEAGVFSDKFLLRTGCVDLLSYIFKSIALQKFQSNKNGTRYEWFVIENMGEEVGFFKVARAVGDCKIHSLELLSIHPAHRNAGIGTAVLRHVSSGTPGDEDLYVHCTKHARAMQHILKKHRLKRNVRFGIPFMEEYRAEAPALESVT